MAKTIDKRNRDKVIALLPKSEKEELTELAERMGLESQGQYVREALRFFKPEALRRAQAREKALATV
jgi:hypothetical protein